MDWERPGIGQMALYLFIESVVLFILVLLIEVRIQSNRPFAGWCHFTNTVRIRGYVQKCTRWQWRSKKQKWRTIAKLLPKMAKGPFESGYSGYRQPSGDFSPFSPLPSFLDISENPSRFCFLVQMRAFVFWTSLRIANVHLKAKPTWILEVVVVVVVVNKMTPSYKCSFAGRPFIQLRQTREILQKLSKVTFPVHCLIYYQHNVNLQNVLKMS